MPHRKQFRFRYKSLPTYTRGKFVEARSRAAFQQSRTPGEAAIAKRFSTTAHRCVLLSADAVPDGKNIRAALARYALLVTLACSQAAITKGFVATAHRFVDFSAAA